MNADSVIAQLQADYPAGTILCLPDHEPTEIICELPLAGADHETSVAIAVIDQSASHVQATSCQVVCEPCAPSS